MKKILLVLMALALMALSPQAAERVVLLEYFTNTADPYSPPADSILDSLNLDPNYDFDLAIIQYHIWWPDAYDPYYRFNIAQDTLRNNYYSNIYVPHAFADGNIDCGSNYRNWRNVVNSELRIESPISLSIEGTFRPESSLIVCVKIATEIDPSLSNYRLRIALIESDLYYPARNGTLYHNMTFRNMIPNAIGEPIELIVGDTLIYTYSFEMSNRLTPENCDLIAFVQSDQNRRVLQAVKISVSELGQPCDYFMGDSNGDNLFNGMDVVYTVNYLKGEGPSPEVPCMCPFHNGLKMAADVNGDCRLNGIDVGFAVNCLRGIGYYARACPECPPAGH